MTRQRSRLVHFVAAGLLVAVGPVAAALGDETPPNTEQIDAWIDQLSDDSYSVRQAAAERLTDSGLPAREALLDFVDTPDPETRAAARRLVALIEHTEFERQLAEFVADVGGHRGITLPGWTEFGNLVGTDRPAREMFADIHRHERALLTKFFRSDAPDVNLYSQRLYRLTNWRANNGPHNASPPLPSCAAMLFLGSLADDQPNPQIALSIANLARRTPISDAMLRGTPNPAIRSLLLAWVKNCPAQSDRNVSDRLTLMSHYSLSEALPVATAVVRREPPYLTVSETNLVLATLLIARFGSEVDIADLEPLVDDHSVWRNAGTPDRVRAVQVRDVALATILHLSGERLEDYGYSGVQRNVQLVFKPQSLGLSSDEHRDAAAAKWRAWRAARPPKAG